MTSNIYPPYARRFVDNILVLEPQYYGDPGPKGFYPELQWPIQTRLGIRYLPDAKKPVYFQLNAVFMRGLRINITKNEIRDYLNVITNDFIFSTFQQHSSKLEMITCLEFSNSKDADDAIIFARAHSHLFSDTRLVVRYSDIHATGRNAGSTRDILLVGEELALSPPYNPISLTTSWRPPPIIKEYGRRDDWNAVGYSRDQFQSKRSAPVNWDSRKPKRRMIPNHVEEQIPKISERPFEVNQYDPQVDRGDTPKSSMIATPPLPNTAHPTLKEAIPSTSPILIKRPSRRNGATIPTGPKPLIERLAMTPPISGKSKSPFPFNITNEELTETLERLKEIAMKLNSKIDNCSSSNLKEQQIRIGQSENDGVSNVAATSCNNEKHPNREKPYSPMKSYFRNDKPKERKRRSSFSHDRNYELEYHECSKYQKRGSRHRYRNDHKPIKKEKGLNRDEIKGFLHHFVPSSNDISKIPEPKYVGISEDGKQLIFGSKRRDVELAFLTTNIENQPSIDQERISNDTQVFANTEDDNSTTDNNLIVITNDNVSSGDIENHIKAPMKQLDVDIDSEIEEEVEEIEDPRFRPKPIEKPVIASQEDIHVIGKSSVEVEEGEIDEGLNIHNGLYSHQHPDINQSTEVSKKLTLNSTNVIRNPTPSSTSNVAIKIKYKIYRVDELSTEILDLLGIKLRYTFRNQSVSDKWVPITSSTSTTNGDVSSSNKVLRLENMRMNSEVEIESLLFSQESDFENEEGGLGSRDSLDKDRYGNTINGGDTHRPKHKNRIII